MTDPTKPLCVFEQYGNVCGLPEDHDRHQHLNFSANPQSHPYTPPAETKPGPKIKWPENYSFSGTFDSNNGKDWVLERALEVACNYLSQTGDWFPPLKTTVREVISDFDAWLKGTLAELQPAAPVSPPRCTCDPDDSPDFSPDCPMHGQYSKREVAPVSPPDKIGQALDKLFDRAEPAVSPEPPRIFQQADCPKCRERIVVEVFAVDNSARKSIDLPLTDASKAAILVDEAGTVGARPEPRRKITRLKAPTLEEVQSTIDKLLASIPEEISAELEYALEQRRVIEASLPSPAPQESDYEVCARIAEKFLGALTEEEWPPSGLCHAELRCDSGVSELMAKRIAAAIRASSPEQPVGTPEKGNK